VDYKDFIEFSKECDILSISTDTEFPKKGIEYDAKMRYTLLGNLYSSIRLLKPNKIIVPLVNKSIISLLPIIGDYECEKLALIPNSDFFKVFSQEEKDWIACFLTSSKCEFVGEGSSIFDISSDMEKIYNILDEQADINMLFRKANSESGIVIKNKLLQLRGHLIEMEYPRPLLNDYR